MLAKETILEIYGLKDSGEKQTDVARRYGVGRHTVYDIWNGRNYGHLTRKPMTTETIKRVDVSALPETMVSARDLILREPSGILVRRGPSGSPAEEEALILDLTPQQAQYLLDHTSYEMQRNIRGASVKYYGAEMLQHRFGVSAIDFGRLGDRLYLLNGHHRMLAQIETGCTIRYSVTIHPVAVYDDLATLYAQIDNNSVRGFQDTMKTERRFAEAGLNNEQATRLSAAMKVIATGLRNLSTDKVASVIRTRSRIYRRDISVGFINEAVLFYACLRGNNKALLGGLQRANVMAVALLTFRYQPEKAPEFWERVAGNDRLPARSPEARLVSLLLETRNTRSSYGAVVSRQVAACWNAWFNGKDEIVSIRGIHRNEPVRLLGTPYDGRKDWQMNEEGVLIDYNRRRIEEKV